MGLVSDLLHVRTGCGGRVLTAAYLHDVWAWMEEKEVLAVWCTFESGALLGGWAATLLFPIGISCGVALLFT